MKLFICALVAPLLVILATLSTFARAQNPYCSSFGTIQPDDVPKLPNKYQLRIEIKSVLEKKIREAHYFYDAPNKRALMRYSQKNIMTRLIYDYELNELLKIDEYVEAPGDVYDPPDGRPLYAAECHAYKLAEAPIPSFFGFTMFNIEAPTIGPPEQPIRFFPQRKGDKEVVGPIVCTRFDSCQYDSFYKANFTAKHYFSDGSFTFAGQDDTYRYIPFKAIFQGVYQTEDSTKNFEIIHDYHDFLMTVPKEVFEIPTGVHCVNKRPTQSIPSMADSFYFSQEITGLSFGVTNTRTLRDVYVLDKLATYKYRNNVAQDATFNSTEPHQYIVDRALGVQYAINMNSGTCRIRGSRPYVPTDDESFNVALDFASHFEEWHSFLPPKGKFTYHGERKFNGILSNRFSDLIRGINITSVNSFEYAYSKPNAIFFNLDKEETNVPVALTINSDLGEFYSSRSSFYNFESSPSAYNRFDVSPCYNSDDVIHFDLVFPYTEQFTADELSQVSFLERSIYTTLYSLTAQPVIRFAYPKVSISSDGNLYARSAIFPLPPAQTLFTYEGDFLLLIGTINSSFRINTTEDCMRFCLTNLRCLSVDYNAATQTCYLNPNTSASGAVQSNSTAYKHYRRNGQGLILYESFELYYVLNGLVIDGSVEISFPNLKTNSMGKAKSLKASKVNIVRGNNNRFGTTALLSRFNMKSSRSKIVSLKDIVQEKVGVSVDDCARICIDRPGVECKTFGYCYLSGNCMISTSAFSEISPSDIVVDDHCDIYEKDPLIHYQRLFIRTNISPKDKKFTPITSASECASKCDSESSIHCRSFNYCRRENVCYLSESHLLDAGGNTTGNVDDLTCEHYSRDYIQDFTYVSTSEIKLDAEVVLRQTDLNACSSTCVSSQSFNCKTFDYCPESKTCLLNSGESQKLSNVQATREQCAHYRREYYYTTSLTYNFISSGSSDAVLITLSVLFAVLSVAAGVLGTNFVFNRYNLAK